jgi:hypothetical protein
MTTPPVSDVVRSRDSTAAVRVVALHVGSKRKNPTTSPKALRWHK